MPRRKQQAPKRLKTDNCEDQEDELEEGKSEDEGYDISMETDEAGNDDNSVDDDYIKNNDGNQTFNKTLRDRRYDLQDQKESDNTVDNYSDNDTDSPLNLSGGNKASHVAHYLPTTSSLGQDDEAAAVVAAATASLSSKAENSSLSTAHATWVRSVQELMSFEGNEQIFGCLECNRRFASNDELVTHLQDTGHITGKPLDPLVNDVSTCKGYDLCIGPNGQLFSKCFLRRHQKRATEADANVCNLRCRQCSKSFPNLLNLTVHMKQSGHYNPNKVNRKKKNKSHHLDYEEEIQVDKVMKCMVCHRSFEALQDLTMHMMETQHFSRVPGYKTETLLQQQQQQHQQNEETCLEASAAEQKEEAWRNRHEMRSRVVVSDPPIIAAARARQGTSTATVSSAAQTATTVHNTVFELPPTIPNDTKMKTVRARLQNKMNSTRVLKCLSCDHSFDSVQSLTKHMTQAGHYQKNSEEEILVPPTEPNGNMVKWELVSAVPTSNGMFTHVKSKVIQNQKKQPMSPESVGEAESPGSANIGEPLPATKTSQSPASSSQSTPNHQAQITYSMNSQEKYINPESYDIPLTSQRSLCNPLGNLEALVHGASTGQFPARTNHANRLANAIPDRFHTVHWTSTRLHKEERFENSLYNSKNTVHINPYTSIKSRHKNNNDEFSTREHTSVSVKDEPLDFSIPKHKSSQGASNNPGGATVVSKTKVKQELFESESCEVPLALTVKKEPRNEDSSSASKALSELEGLAGKIKSEPGKYESVLTRRSMRVKHLLRLKRMNQLLPTGVVSQPLQADTPLSNREDKAQREKKAPEFASAEETLSTDENDIPKEDSTIPRSLYQPVNQNGYLATTKGGVLPMATGAYQTEGDDPLKAMDKLVQNAVAGRHGDASHKVKGQESNHNADSQHQREHDCGLKIAMYGPIMGNDDNASNPLEEMDKLVNAAM